MKLVDARAGEVVHIRQRPATFSFFPTFQGTKREGVHSSLFVTEPWNIIQHKLEKLTDTNARRQALAFLVQGRDFFIAAQNSDVSAAKPLLLYYSFLNLAKCLSVARKGTPLGRVHHGLSEKLPTTPGAIHGTVSIDITKNPGGSAFVMFAQAIGAPLPTPVAPKTSVEVRSQDFLAQVLIGHRIYCQADAVKEKFISLERIEYMQDTADQEVWLRVRAYADDFTRLGYGLTDLSKNLGTAGTWRNVKCSATIDGRRIIEAETTATRHYGHRPSQVLSLISNDARQRLWRSVTSYPPYRKYYIYLPTTRQVLLNQLLTIYLATFFFGSITRYKPEQFDQILKSSIGPFVFEFFSNQPTQFLYLMASEFMGQEVAKAAIT
ncbi:YaaC family protein [Tritonibacter scottomollicae]|uniref:YaaC family protein n=1 Tax=Tritonibacter scottomollicae TaxID=483013 RepID=A0ABZ0HB80_TRISK|nr:YaaC family protein [Tritonibacter scottomollicae]WOI32065.1 YaaC family protein [Tritonibacter scottomollicae]